LTDQYSSLFCAAKFAVGSAIGFLDTEIILTTGTYVLYGKLSAPQSAFYSSSFWTLNIIAFVIGVSVAFFVNESLLIRREGRRISYDLRSILERLAKFQLVFLAGNLVMIGIQMILLKEFSFPPIGGNIVGSIVSFPIRYFFSLYYVWQMNRVKSPYQGTNKQADPRRNPFPQLRLHESMESLSRAILTTYGNVNMIVREYKLDVAPSGENETAIDFSLKMDITEK